MRKLSKEEMQFIDSNPDMSSRKISKKLWGTSSRKSTVNDYRKRNANMSMTCSYPRILIIDIETAPTLAYIWRIFNENISKDMIVDDWSILSYCAKWVGENDIYYNDVRYKKDLSDDVDLLEEIWNLLDEADAVVAHNGKGFDFKKINARLVSEGFQPPSSYKKIDTLEIAKRHFGFTSNRLEYLTDRLCKSNKKSDHKSYPGFKLWKAAMERDEKAFEEMEEYNIMDVLSLEELLFILAPWSDKIPNLSVYTDTLDNLCLCGSTEFSFDGYYYTNVSVFERFRCNHCGSEKRKRKNVLSKQKRNSLLTNVAQ